MDILSDEISNVLRELGVESQRGDGRDEGPDDFIVTIPVRTGTMEAVVDAKWRSQPLGPAEAVRWRESRGGNAILALPSIPKQRGDQYRALGINYVDSGGNAFLNFPGFHVHVEGRKPRLRANRGTSAQPASTNPAGLKVAFVLLVAPESIGLSHERLAALAQVSKGTVTNTLIDLRDRGHVFGERGSRTLIDWDRLAQDWVDGYVRDLRPRLKELELTGPQPDWWTRDWVDIAAGTIGGGSALAHFGAELVPDRTVLYSDPPWREIRRDARLTRDGQAQVILRERFWSAGLLHDDRFVPPLLAYADALAGGDPREASAAQKLANLQQWAFAR
ncbi:hypothetical protein SAMN02745244_01491 [Tessaracoccus bendigoensis DSM 12906]|uniref:HTH crp-type domain-containing protein n=1 Tax=Tessaracoccus bendigoensis DSM 12906 TaxID=1123357 RepID=A0A1M6FNB6_9ACTN|nr:type IV toxin-antitoxin system AbiEi family antitoxin [Tessaracoccus bendigoensis]SHI99248.1 hypothetical protein SAMN02745244_01491 [Tessaracoccus bendigoensis DSM 12906]